MAEGEKARLVAWSEELRAVHARLRQALAVTQQALAAIMESHFRYEERQLLVVLDTLELDADTKRVLGRCEAPARRRPKGQP